jgi:chromatin remodeling complex protein RSC6
VGYFFESLEALKGHVREVHPEDAEGHPFETEAWIIDNCGSLIQPAMINTYKMDQTGSLIAKVAAARKESEEEREKQELERKAARKEAREAARKAAQEAKKAEKEAEESAAMVDVQEMEDEVGGSGSMGESEHLAADAPDARVPASTFALIHPDQAVLQNRLKRSASV